MNQESAVSSEVILPPKSNRAVFEAGDVESLQQLTTTYWCKGRVAVMNSTYLKYSSIYHTEGNSVGILLEEKFELFCGHGEMETTLVW